MTMFDGLTMVSYDGHNRNKMMVDHVWTMVDHGRPWSIMVDHGLVVKCSQGYWRLSLK